jgi:Late endosomal/lysosomal adaptor and MAPK and MTOR activator
MQDTDSRLLFDDPNTINYGSFGDHNAAALQADPQDVQREAEALQKIVAQTSK